MKTCRLIVAFLLPLVLVASLRADEISDWADSIVRARSLNRPLPAHAHRSAMATEHMAYQVQQKVVQRQSQGARLIGHKAGLTSVAAQTRFGLLDPVAGTLISNQQLANGAYVGLRNYPGMVIEMEIGYMLKLSFHAPPRTVAEVKDAVREIMPVIELPDINFDPPGEMTGLDIIASNVAATKVIVGRGKPAVNLDPNTIRTTLTRDGTTLAEGVGSDALDDQWEALLWLIQQRIQMGYEVKRNDLLITGALGTVVEAAPGTYRADFGELGQLTFSMR